MAIFKVLELPSTHRNWIKLSSTMIRDKDTGSTVLKGKTSILWYHYSLEEDGELSVGL